MKRLIFYGYSDDLFVVEGPDIHIEFDTYASGEEVYMRVWTCDGEGLIVGGRFTRAGFWIISVTPASVAEKPIPLWPIRIERSESVSRSSPLLVIEAPDDVQVELALVMQHSVGAQLRCFTQSGDDCSWLAPLQPI